MAGPACKVVINGGIRALVDSLERILIEPQLNGGKVPENERMEMIQQLADLDQIVMHGGVVAVSLVGLMSRLEKLGVLSPDIWGIYARQLTQNANAKKENRNESH